DAVEAARDKALMRQRFSAAGLLTPGFRTVEVDEDPARVATIVRFPCVVKPLDLSGSQGVVKADNADGFPDVLARVRAIVAACQRDGVRPAVLVEDFIAGDEVAVEDLIRHGGLVLMAIFSKPITLNDPCFVETYLLTTARYMSCWS